MAGTSVTPSATVTRKPDDVGTQGDPAVGGGHATPEQAALTSQGTGGRSDADRRDEWSENGPAGRAPVPVGGSSQGESDKTMARPGGEERRIVDDHETGKTKDGGLHDRRE
ncbi:hypothetical protein [Methylobacterium sp. Leaf399]|uniref:hypothetical protein n=1 Tax=Methylobacterium sp. Leaf399 TaxID=1736364 RepID=UPI000B0D553D|nr:hypothetical protein [Methylobacterium sp. Leaf399]